MGGSDQRIEGDLRAVQNTLERLGRADMALDQIERLERMILTAHIENMKKLSAIATMIEERARRYNE